MARSFNASDEAYNARRRYYRSAERYLDKAENSSGETAARYRTLARVDLENALDTYDPNAPKQKMSKNIRDAASKLGIDVDKRRSRYKSNDDIRRKNLINKSTDTLEGKLNDPEERRQREASAIFSNPATGRRILGATVDIWRDAATDSTTGRIDRKRILPALYSYFNVNNLADLLDKIESFVGEKFYEPDDENDEIYRYVKLTIANKMME